MKFSQYVFLNKLIVLHLENKCYDINTEKDGKGSDQPSPLTVEVPKDLSKYWTH